MRLLEFLNTAMQSEEISKITLRGPEAPDRTRRMVEALPKLVLKEFATTGPLTAGAISPQ